MSEKVATFTASGSGRVVAAIVVQAASAASAFLSVLLVARFLSPAEFGFYALFVAVATTASTLGRVGYRRVVTADHAAGNHSDRDDLQNWAAITLRNQSTLYLALAVFIALAWFADWISNAVASALIATTLIALSSDHVGMRAGFLLGSGATLSALALSSLVRPVGLMILVVGVTASGLALSGPRALWLLALAGGLTAFIGWRLSPLKTADAIATPRFGRALTIGATASVFTFNSSIDLFSVSYFTGLAETGTYRLAAQLAAVILIPSVAINAIYERHFARDLADGDTDRFRARLKQIIIILAASSLLMAMIVMVAADPLFATLFSQDYRPSWPLLAWLTAGTVLAALFSPLVTLAIASHHEVEFLKACLIATLSNVVLNIALVPSFGPVGAAAATLFATVILRLALWFLLPPLATLSKPMAAS